jgi:hypothetical protein
VLENGPSSSVLNAREGAWVDGAGGGQRGGRRKGGGSRLTGRGL